MKTHAILSAGFHRGVSLVETIVAIGVLAVVAPLTLAAMTKAGGTGMAARSDTRAPAIIEACLSEVQLARKGTSPYLPQLSVGEDFPSAGGDPICLAFDRAGTLLGKIGTDGYESGAAEFGQKEIFYFATITGKQETSTGSAVTTPLLKVTIQVEHPAILPVAKRSRTDFITKLP